MKLRVFYIPIALATMIVTGAAAQTAAPLQQSVPQASPQVQTTQTTHDTAETTALKDIVQRLQNRLNDWPQLARYREANAKVAPPQQNENRVVFLGDSITDSWQRTELSTFFSNRYYIDRGISGQTTPQMLLRMRSDVIELQPKVIIILAGTNDLAGNTGPMSLVETEANLASICELARVHKIRVVLSSLLPVSDYGHDRQGVPTPQTKRRSPDKILELNKWIKDYATANHHTYLDYFSNLVDANGMLKAELSGDGLHPNSAGYAVMEPLAEKAIAIAMKRKP